MIVSPVFLNAIVVLRRALKRYLYSGINMAVYISLRVILGR